MSDISNERQIIPSVLGQLGRNLSDTSIPLSVPDHQLQTVLIEFLMRGLTESWREALRDELPNTAVASFYDDDMLGYQICSRINAIYFQAYREEIDLEANQSILEIVWNIYGSLTEYLDLMHRFSFGGDITKRACEAMAAIALACPTIYEELSKSEMTNETSTSNENWRDYVLSLASDFR